MMGRSNRAAARLLHKYNAHAATDIAGLGLLGHASHLARVQKNEVNLSSTICLSSQLSVAEVLWQYVST